MLRTDNWQAYALNYYISPVNPSYEGFLHQIHMTMLYTMNGKYQFSTCARISCAGFPRAEKNMSTSLLNFLGAADNFMTAKYENRCVSAHRWSWQKNYEIVSVFRGTEIARTFRGQNAIIRKQNENIVCKTMKNLIRLHGIFYGCKRVCFMDMSSLRIHQQNNDDALWSMCG